jgi:hypothetical protein
MINEPAKNMMALHGNKGPGKENFQFAFHCPTTRI